MKYAQDLVMLAVYAVVLYVVKQVLQGAVDENSIATNLGMGLMSLPRMAMMILMAIPEQLVMFYFEPSMSLYKRLMVSVAMYVIHFAWNGMVMKPERSYNELVWIVGTAMFAVTQLGAKQSTGIALVAADSAMTLALRGLA